MHPRSRIALELGVLVAGWALFVLGIQFPSAATAVPQAAWKVLWALLAANNLLLVTEVIFYVRYRVDWLSNPM